MKTEWVVFDSLTQSFKCERCGQSYQPNLPCPLTTFCAMGKDFVLLHRRCKPKAGAA